MHRLSDLGAVVTHASHGTSQDGFDAEWRLIALLTVEGDATKRGELFDEADLDAALARFDELTRPAPRLENAANRVLDRYLAHFPSRDWDAMADMLAGGFSADDRRRVVNAGVRSGRDAEIANMQVIAEIGCAAIASTPIATRGERLVLTRQSVTGADSPESFHTDILGVVEIDADNQVSAHVVFDPDDLDAAFDELDARYLADEAAAYRDTWSVIAEAYASISRQELPPLTPDCVNIDHRRTAVAIAPGDLTAYIRSGRELGENVRPRIEVVHRLTNRGAVITYAAHGTSPAGFEAEWREISLSMVDGDLVNRVELFDEADIDAALARFDQLTHAAPQLENTASQVCERYRAVFRGP